MGNLCSHSIYPIFNAPMETPRQSYDKVEKCSGVSTETSLQPTKSCELKDTPELNENKITNEPKGQNMDKCVLYCTTCRSQMLKENAKQHKQHVIVSLKTAADEARKRLEKINESVQLKSKAYLDKIKDFNEEKRLTTEDLHRVVDSEFDRINEALNDSLESVKKQRELQYNNFLQELENTKLRLERNVKTIMTKQRKIASISDDDLLKEEGTFTKEIQDFQTYLQLPSFDMEGESVENALIQAVYSEKEKEKTRKEYKQLQIEKEYFENTLETVMTFLQSLVNYKENKKEKKENIKSSNLPQVPKEIEKSTRKKIKTRRESAKDELQHLKNIAIGLIDLERQIEAASSTKRTDEETTHESAKAENETQNDETMVEIQRLTSENEGMRNVIKAIEEWINICHNNVKQNEVDPNKLTLPSEQRLDESGMQILETNRKKLEAIREHMKKLKSKMASTVNELEQKKEEEKVAGLERERTSSRMQQMEREMSSISTQLEEKREEAKAANLERDKTLTRLSEVAGSRLRENNPMIADLSDDYRPTKLGEKFGEVYDNEWTDAYQSITKKLKLTEKEAIRLLLEFVKVIYETCTEIAQTQLNDMFSSIKVKQSAKETKVPGFLKKIKDFQKQITPEMMAVVARAIKKKKFKNVKLEEGFKPCRNYIHSCIQLCWMMNVQDPPVVLVFDEDIGADIKTGLFRYYTKSGRSMDYMVWPAMLLHEGGALLQKGVVQPQ